MEHPLIENISHLTLDELQTKISDLNKKLGYAMRIGNGDLAFQIRMALETFQSQFMAKQQALWDDARRKGNDHSDKINIS